MLPNAPAVAILAGGASRRMGTDKATLALGGTTFLERAVGAARRSGLDVYVVGRDEQPGVGRVDGWIDDETPGGGPLRALASALRAIDRELLVIACDMPLLDEHSIAWLAQRQRPEGVDAVIVRNAGRIEPMFARYTPTCLAIADALAMRGQRSMMALLDAIDSVAVDAPAWLCERLRNVNTSDDLDALRKSPLAGLT